MDNQNEESNNFLLWWAQHLGGLLVSWQENCYATDKHVTRKIVKLNFTSRLKPTNKIFMLVFDWEMKPWKINNPFERVKDMSLKWCLVYKWSLGNSYIKKKKLVCNVLYCYAFRISMWLIQTEFMNKSEVLNFLIWKNYFNVMVTKIACNILHA